LKEAVIKAASGKIPDAVAILATRTVEIKSPEKRHQTIAKDYAALPESERLQTLIVAGTNDSRQEINAFVRKELKLDAGTTVPTYDSIDMTRAEKKQAGSYAVGQVVLLEGRRVAGLEQRVYYDVIAVDSKSNKLSLRDGDGQIHQVDPSILGSMSAFTKEQIDLAAGDWVRVTRNNSNLGIANGERYQVEQVMVDSVKFTNGIDLPRTGRLHMQYGYAATVHSAQGLTTNRVMIDADTKSLTSNRAVFYVAISRPRNELKIYTDDKAKLSEVMSREPKKYAALELRSDVTEKEIADMEIERQLLAQAEKDDKKGLARARKL
jgi:hypothetical protein